MKKSYKPLFIGVVFEKNILFYSKIVASNGRILYNMNVRLKDTLHSYYILIPFIFNLFFRTYL